MKKHFLQVVVVPIKSERRLLLAGIKEEFGAKSERKVCGLEEKGNLLPAAECLSVVERCLNNFLFSVIFFFNENKRLKNCDFIYT